MCDDSHIANPAFWNIIHHTLHRPTFAETPVSSSTVARARPAPGLIGRTPRATIVLFAGASFLSAFLLFQVQLIVSKHILPWFGGSAAVWTTSLLVFQLLLLAGYVYSHLVSVRLSPAAQARLHGGLLAAAFLLMLVLSFFWPSAITPGAGWKPQPGGSPARDVAAIILVSVGLPFFVLSTTAPLLQGWFARLGGGARTYKLYSVSNLGSLLGLLTFPFLLEPALRLQLQGGLWSLLFGVFAVGCGVCAWLALRTSGRIAEGVPDAPPTSTEAAPRPFAYALWFLLAACASALLLATTNLLCQEVTTVPLLWVLPLSLYLLSFILCFDHPRWYQRAVFHPLFAVSLLVTCAALSFGQYRAQLAALPVLLFLSCMICHGELVRLKPGVTRLTSFYLAISAGGAAGGVFVAAVAPQVFTSFVEFQWALAVVVILTLVTLALDAKSWIFRSDFWRPLLMVCGVLLAGYGGSRWLPEIAQLVEETRFYLVTVLIGVVAVMGAAVLKATVGIEKRGFRFVQMVVAGIVLLGLAALYRSAQPKPGLQGSARSFYGVVSVVREAGFRQLMHGQTIHGGQLDPPMDRLPVTYFGPNSGIGVVLRAHPQRSFAPLRIGIVGMGAGTLAAYGRPGDYIRYYEINPDVVKLSSGAEPTFTYIRDSAARIAVALGDARLSLEREAAAGERQNFDVLVLDAFSGDAIPVHLLTREAFETYWQHLDPQSGILAVHITSRHVNLAPVLLGAAAHFHAACVITYNRRQGPVFDSGWVLMARRPDLLNLPGLEPITVRYVHSVGPRLWTDDYSDIFRLIF